MFWGCSSCTAAGESIRRALEMGSAAHPAVMDAIGAEVELVRPAHHLCRGNTYLEVGRFARRVNSQSGFDANLRPTGTAPSVLTRNYGLNLPRRTKPVSGATRPGIRLSNV